MQRLIAYIFFLVACSKLYAQDIHYSQFYADPLFINCANTGYFKGAYRLGANYKAQWSFAVPSGIGTYNSYGGFADLSILDNKINDLDWMGVGLHFSGDVAGDGKLGIKRLHFSLAYHKGFDKQNHFMLSAGFAGGIVQRSIDFEKLYFNNQWTGEGFDQSVNNFEPYNKPRSMYADMDAGIALHMAFNELHRLSISASLKHINRPKDTFYNSLNRLAMRPLLSVQYDYAISPVQNLMTALYFSHDKKAKEIAIAALYSFKPAGVKSESAFDVVLHYRMGDAFAPGIGYEFRQMRILFSYDITTSNLSRANRGNGGPEISIVYVGNRKKSLDRKQYCPVF